MLSNAPLIVVDSASLPPQAVKTRVLLGPLQVALGIAQNRETRICLYKSDLWRHQAAKRGACSTEPHLNHKFSSSFFFILKNDSSST